MSNAQNIKKDYFWNTLGVLAQNAISPLLLIVVTRVNGIADSGIFSFAFAVSLMLWALGMWGGRTYQVSDVKAEYSQKSYVMVRLILSIVILVIAICFATVNNYSAQMTWTIVLLTIFKIAESYADVLYGILQANGKLYVSGKSLVIKAVLGFVAFVGIDMIFHDMQLAVISLVLVNFAILLLYDLPYAKRFDGVLPAVSEVRKYISNAFRILRTTVWVFVMFFLAMFTLNIPRYFIEKNAPEEVGYFGIIAMPITLIVLLITFILQPKVRDMAVAYQSRKLKEFHDTTLKILGLAAMVGAFVLAVSAVAGVWLLNLVFGVNFDAYWLPLTIVIVGGLANGLVTVLLNVYVMMRRLRQPVIVLIGTNVVLAIACLLFMREHSLLFGVSAYAVTSGAQLLALMGSYLYSKRRAHNA